MIHSAVRMRFTAESQMGVREWRAGLYLDIVIDVENKFLLSKVCFDNFTRRSHSNRGEKMTFKISERNA